jgi:DNA-binding NtrC family response regulator
LWGALPLPSSDSSLEEEPAADEEDEIRQSVGLFLLQRIKRLWPALPVVVYTASSQGRETVSDLGASACLHKQSDLSLLKTTAYSLAERHALAHRQAQAQSELRALAPQPTPAQNSIA